MSLTEVMPLLGLGSFLVEKNLPMPRGLYSDLATWATINFLYKPQVTRQVEALHRLAAQPEKTARLLATAHQHHGHSIAFAIERTKIELSDRGDAVVSLDFIEDRLERRATKEGFDLTIDQMTSRLHATAAQCIVDAGLAPDAVETIFFTGGCSRVPAVRQAISCAAPSARCVGGADFLSIALGLTREAGRRSLA